MRLLARSGTLSLSLGDAELARWLNGGPGTPGAYQSDQANLAYGLYPDWRGRGFATHAVRIAVEFCVPTLLSTQH